LPVVAVLVKFSCYRIPTRRDSEQDQKATSKQGSVLIRWLSRPVGIL